MRELYPTRSIGCFIKKPITIDQFVRRVKAELEWSVIVLILPYPIAVVEVIMKEKASNHVWKYKVKSCCQDRTPTPGEQDINLTQINGS